MNEKLDFTILPDDGMLEASIYNNDKVRIGYFHIFSNESFNVIAYISSKYSEIKKDCKDIYEALDVANQWWNENKKLYLSNVENKPIKKRKTKLSVKGTKGRIRSHSQFLFKQKLKQKNGKK